MKPDYATALETKVDRALKQLPELSAPRTLWPRVQAELERQAARPWYRQPWATWPAPWRVISLTLLAALFAGMCWAGSLASHPSETNSLMQALYHGRASLGALWNVVQVLYETAGLLLKQLGPWFVPGCLLILVLANALCLGLGTLCVRVAFARTEIAGFERTL